MSAEGSFANIEVIYFDYQSKQKTIALSRHVLPHTVQQLKDAVADALSVHREYIRLAHRGVELKDMECLLENALGDNCKEGKVQLLCVLQKDPRLVGVRLVREFVEGFRNESFSSRWAEKDYSVAMKNLDEMTSSRDIIRTLFVVEKCLKRSYLMESWEFFRKAWIAILGRNISPHGIIAWLSLLMEFIQKSAFTDEWLKGAAQKWEEKAIKFVVEDKQGQFFCIQLCLLHVQAHICSPCFSADWSDWQLRFQWLNDLLNVSFGDFQSLCYLFSVLASNIQHQFFKSIGAAEDALPITDWIQGWIASLESAVKDANRKDFYPQIFAEHLLTLTERISEAALDEEWKTTWKTWNVVLDFIIATPLGKIDSESSDPPIDSNEEENEDNHDDEGEEGEEDEEDDESGEFTEEIQEHPDSILNIVIKEEGENQEQEGFLLIPQPVLRRYST